MRSIRTKEFDWGLVAAQLVGRPAVVLAVLALLGRQNTKRRVGKLVGGCKVGNAAEVKVELKSSSSETTYNFTCNVGYLTVVRHLSTRWLLEVDTLQRGIQDPCRTARLDPDAVYDRKEEMSFSMRHATIASTYLGTVITGENSTSTAMLRRLPLPTPFSATQ